MFVCFAAHILKPQLGSQGFNHIANKIWVPNPAYHARYLWLELYYSLRLPDPVDPVLAIQQTHGVSATLVDQAGESDHSRKCLMQCLSYFLPHTLVLE